MIVGDLQRGVRTWRRLRTESGMHEQRIFGVAIHRLFLFAQRCRCILNGARLGMARFGLLLVALLIAFRDEQRQSLGIFWVYFDCWRFTFCWLRGSGKIDGYCSRSRGGRVAVGRVPRDGCTLCAGFLALCDFLCRHLEQGSHGFALELLFFLRDELIDHFFFGQLREARVRGGFGFLCGLLLVFCRCRFCGYRRIVGSECGDVVIGHGQWRVDKQTEVNSEIKE